MNTFVLFWALLFSYFVIVNMINDIIKALKGFKVSYTTSILAAFTIALWCVFYYLTQIML